MLTIVSCKEVYSGFLTKSSQGDYCRLAAINSNLWANISSQATHRAL